MRMSPISAEMNGNVSGGKEMNSNTANSSSTKSLLEECTEDADSGGNFTTSVGTESDSLPSSGRPLTTSTPIADQSHEENDLEQPTSSTGSNYGFSAPKYGTLIPNRLFVGGISPQTTDTELLHLFSRYGAVRGTKIIMDRAGVSKGYGFVTFETEDEAKRLYIAMNNKEMGPIVLRDRRLNIAPAVKKQVVQPMIRQNIPYASQIDGISPPPFPTTTGTSYFFSQPHPQQTNSHHHHHQQTEFFCQPAAIPETYFQQTSAYPHAHQAPLQQQSSTLLHGSFYNPVSQTSSTPSGTVFYVSAPMQSFPPYQQNPSVSTQDQCQWAAGTAGSNFAAAAAAAATNMNGSFPWRYSNPGGGSSALPSVALPPNPFQAIQYNHGLQSSSSHQTTPPYLHPQLLHEHLLNQAAAASASTFSQSAADHLYYYSPAVISSPH